MRICWPRSLMAGLLCASLSVGAAGCLPVDEDDDEDARDPGGASSDPATGGTTGDRTRTRAAVEVQIGRDVYAGAFKLGLRTAKLKQTSEGARGTIVIDFGSENLSDRVINPLGRCVDGMAPSLELGGETLYGECDAPSVPAYARGDGTLNFAVKDAKAAAAALPSAVLRIGDEPTNHVVVPFAQLDQAVTLEGAPVTADLSPFAYRKSTVTLKRAVITYSDWWRNWFLGPEGKANFLVHISVGDVTGTSGNWSEYDTTLVRPDGVSVVSYLNEYVDIGYKKDLYLVYEIKDPVSGTYTLTFGQGADAVTRTFVVP